MKTNGWVQIIVSLTVLGSTISAAIAQKWDVVFAGLTGCFALLTPIFRGSSEPQPTIKEGE